VRRGAEATIERVAPGASFIDVIDRVLDKGLVIDARVRLSVFGIELATVDARVIVASIETYLRYADDVDALAFQRATGIAMARSRLPRATTPEADEG
jgi:hypothetical protein